MFKTETDILVIGYGNTLRGDDAVGPRVADAVEQMGLKGVNTLTCPMLTPELAEAIAQSGKTIFVDAAVDSPNHVRWRKLEPNPSCRLLAHAATPDTLLALALNVFGRAPEAWWLTIPAVDLGFKEGLSPQVADFLEESLEKIKAFCAGADPKQSDLGN